MLIQINTDKNISGQQELANDYSRTIEKLLSRFTERITRIEVHLRDENSEKGGSDDKLCFLEARVKGMDPVTTSHKAETLDFALNGATKKMKRALENTFAKAGR